MAFRDNHNVESFVCFDQSCSCSNRRKSAIVALNFSLFTLARSIFRIINLQLLLCLFSRTGLNTGLYFEGTCYLYVPVKKPRIRAQWVQNVLVVVVTAAAPFTKILNQENSKVITHNMVTVYDAIRIRSSVDQGTGYFQIDVINLFKRHFILKQQHFNSNLFTLKLSACPLKGYHFMSQAFQLPAHGLLRVSSRGQTDPWFQEKLSRELLFEFP